MMNTMKLRFVYTLLFLPLAVFGQKTEPMVVSGAIKPAIKTSDTVITKDPQVPGAEYWTILTPTGNLKMQGRMMNGLKEGVWREYGGTNYVLLKTEEYSKGKKNGASTTLNNSGMVTLDETYRNDLLEGRRITYSQSARIKVTENFKNGLLDGERKSFYDDGKTQEEGNYSAGQRDGVAKWYLQNGNLSLEYTYTKGSLNGSAKMYDEKGLIRSEGNYVNDNEEGEWKEYENGQAVKKVIYKGGSVVKEIPYKQ